MSATIGPCLAKLDPAVAQAVQSKFQVCIPFSILLFLKRGYFKKKTRQIIFLSLLLSSQSDSKKS